MQFSKCYPAYFSCVKEFFFAKPLEKDHNKYYNICGKGSLAEPIINLRKKDLYVRYQDRTYHYSKGKPADETKLGFGHIFTDHMFVMNYDAGQGWHDARIVPYGDLSLSPAAMCLHYGQEIFEGLKAYRTADGSVQLFRPQENFKRMNNSAERMVIPKINEEDMLYALKTLVKMEQDWVPHTEGASLYIRPFIIAVDPYVGVKPADHYLFIIILSPSGAYYSTGLNPVKIYVENKYVRAVRGGTGFAKTAANYAISLAGQEEAHEQDYEQVLWLDGVERKYVEEVGSMNIFFVIDGEVVTPQLLGSVLLVSQESLLSRYARRRVTR